MSFVNHKILKSIVSVSIGVTVLLLSVFFLEAFHSVQLRLSHFLYQGRPVSEDIVIVALDSELINSEFGDFTSDKKRSYFAKVIESVERASPSSIMIDWDLSQVADTINISELSSLAETTQTATEFSQEISEYFSELHPYDAELVTTLSKYSNVYLFKYPTELTGLEGNVFQYSSEATPHPIFSEVARSAFVIASESPTGNVQTIYTIPTYIDVGNGVEEHMDLQLAQQFSGEMPEIPLENGEMQINYAAPPYSYTYVSFADVLRGKVPSSMFENKIVLIGPTANIFQDRQYTPIDSTIPMPGIEIHANAIQTILEEAYLVHQGMVDFALTVGLILLLSALLFMHAPVLWGGVVLAVEIAIFPFYAQWRFDHGVIVNLIWPIVGLVAVYLAVLVYRNFTEFAEKRKLKEAFGRYVSPELVEQIGEHPEMLKLGGERRSITALFLDIENFTNLSESLSPQETVRVINMYFDALSKVIMSQGGTVDKYEGDAIMALFGAPVPMEAHALKGCETALLIREKMAELNARSGYDLNIRIGLSSGEAIVGNMGSENRFDYTAMGDTVNTASRLEGANKFYSTRILVSEGTYQMAKEKIFMRRVDTVCLKGKDKALNVYEVLGPIEGASEEGKTVVQTWETALTAYQKGEWDLAEKGMKIVLEKMPEDGPSKTLLGRIAMMRMTPRQNWDGVWKFEVK